MNAQDFMNDPKSFMESGEVVVPYVPSGVQPTTMEVYLTHTTYKLATGERKVWGLAKKTNDTADSKGPFMKIFWAPYNNNSFGATGTHIMLTSEDGRSYLFTAGMNMCTLGVGSQTGDGGCRVAHVNVKGNGSTLWGTKEEFNLQQSKIQTGWAKGRMGTGTNVITPEDYMKEEGSGLYQWSATTFARRENGTWKFYFLRWMRTGSGLAATYRHGGVHEAL